MPVDVTARSAVHAGEAEYIAHAPPATTSGSAQVAPKTTAARPWRSTGTHWIVTLVPGTVRMPVLVALTGTDVFMSGKQKFPHEVCVYGYVFCVFVGVCYGLG